LVGHALGHPVHIVTDPRIDAITLAKLNALGCVVHIVDQMSQQGWQSARLERLAELLSELPGAYWTRQYENIGNPLGYVELADELLAQLDRIDVLVGPVGSGGSLCGTARQLRARGMRPRVVGVDAVGSVIFGQPDRPGRLQSGLGNSLIAPNVDFAVIDEVHWLSDAEAFQATHELAHQEQIFAGNSSGSAYLVARWLSLDAPPGTRIVALLPDRGDRYAATLYNPDYLRKHDLHLPVELPASPKDADLDTPVSEWSRAHLRAPAAV
jgi:cysteine synthase A